MTCTVHLHRHTGRWSEGDANHQKVIDALDLLGPCPATRVAVALDLSTSAVLAHLHDAEAIGTVTHTGRGKSTRWSIQ